MYDERKKTELKRNIGRCGGPVSNNQHHIIVDIGREIYEAPQNWPLRFWERWRESHCYEERGGGSEDIKCEHQGDLIEKQEMGAWELGLMIGNFKEASIMNFSLIVKDESMYVQLERGVFMHLLREAFKKKDKKS